MSNWLIRLFPDTRSRILFRDSHWITIAREIKEIILINRGVVSYQLRSSDNADLKVVPGGISRRPALNAATIFSA
jgi:hypothetical protein